MDPEGFGGKGVSWPSSSRDKFKGTWFSRLELKLLHQRTRKKGIVVGLQSNKTKTTVKDAVRGQRASLDNFLMIISQWQ